MKYLNSKILNELEIISRGFKEEVTLKFFTQEFECRFCADTHGMMEELSGASDKIKLEVYDFVKDKHVAEEYKIEKIPGLVVMNQKDHGIRFYGIPAGYEFSSLIEAIKLVSTGKVELSEETKKFLDGLDREIRLEVFVTPTCPYCPKAVILAHHMAYYSDMVAADMVEATEFPQLAQKYGVMGVPKTVINGSVYQEGAAPENQIVVKLKEAFKK